MTRRPDCPPMEQMEAWLALDASDERRAHLDACPRCRANVAAYRAFMQGAETPLARADEADAALALAIERELAPARVTPADTRARRPWFAGLLEALAAPALRPAWSVAAVLVVAGGVWIATQKPAERMVRGTDSARIETLAPSLSGSGVELAWQRVSGADRYDVAFFALDLSDLAHADGLAEPRLMLHRDALPAGLVPSQKVLWQVIAYAGERELSRSVTQAVTLP